MVLRQGHEAFLLAAQAADARDSSAAVGRTRAYIPLGPTVVWVRQLSVCFDSTSFVVINRACRLVHRRIVPVAGFRDFVSYF